MFVTIWVPLVALLFSYASTESCNGELYQLSDKLKCYWLTSVSKTADLSQEVCANDGGNLGTIYNADVSNFVKNQLLTSDPCSNDFGMWTGMTSRVVPGTWTTWLGESLDWNRWPTDHPDDKGPCVGIFKNSMEWDNHACSNLKHCALCEKDVSTKTTVQETSPQETTESTSVTTEGEDTITTALETTEINPIETTESTSVTTEGEDTTTTTPETTEINPLETTESTSVTTEGGTGITAPETTEINPLETTESTSVTTEGEDTTSTAPETTEIIQPETTGTTFGEATEEEATSLPRTSELQETVYSPNTTSQALNITRNSNNSDQEAKRKWKPMYCRKTGCAKTNTAFGTIQRSCQAGNKSSNALKQKIAYILSNLRLDKRKLHKFRRKFRCDTGDRSSDIGIGVAFFTILCMFHFGLLMSEFDIILSNICGHFPKKPNVRT